MCYRTAHKVLPPQGGTACLCADGMHQTCCQALSSCEVLGLRSSPPMVGSSQRASKCTHPPCTELSHAYTHAQRSVSTYQPLWLPSSTKRGHQKDRKTGTIARSLPRGHAWTISRWPERLLLSFIQRNCGPTLLACWCLEVLRHLRSFT